MELLFTQTDHLPQLQPLLQKRWSSLVRTKDLIDWKSQTLTHPIKEALLLEVIRICQISKTYKGVNVTKIRYLEITPKVQSKQQGLPLRKRNLQAKLSHSNHTQTSLIFVLIIENEDPVELRTQKYLILLKLKRIIRVTTTQLLNLTIMRMEGLSIHQWMAPLRVQQWGELTSIVTLMKIAKNTPQLKS
jgi:hypothetical protein